MLSYKEASVSASRKGVSVFTSLVHRASHSPEWQKIPWHDPDFSRRMLEEHLNQDHDLASRRQRIIDQHVAWLHRKILNECPSHILDLGCGPGFYVKRLSALGHTCVGMDFSPASIAYAREQHPDGTYILGDVRSLAFGENFDMVCLIFGELNAFAPTEATDIIRRAHAALKPGGKLILEVHTYDLVFRSGQESPSWHTAEKGLFSDQPYLCLVESSFEIDHAATRFYVYAADTGAMQQYTSMLQAYSDDEYRHLLSMFARVMFYPSLTGSGERSDLFVIAAEK